jgi:hypothetical protein
VGELHPPWAPRTAVGLNVVPKNGWGWAAPSWRCAPDTADTGPTPAPAPAPAPLDTRVELDDRCSVCPGGGKDSDADGEDSCGNGDSDDLDCETANEVRAGGEDGLSSVKPVPRAVKGGKLGKEVESIMEVSWPKDVDRDKACGDSAARGGGL